MRLAVYAMDCVDDFHWSSLVLMALGIKTLLYPDITARKLQQVDKLKFMGVVEDVDSIPPILSGKPNGIAKVCWLYAHISFGFLSCGIPFIGEPPARLPDASRRFKPL
ncbi:unnamed protein product [Phytophthora fragariaefolia]|uniref:Unnamed protein product n=1 Tax=Phytophthora fragariaefolia TaxID=1490495 RepID=A0A9W6YLS1_9STRA|nr:unnamed protein product [Phytophthora fragariaefolia]